MTAALIVRILLTHSIWFRGGRNLAYAASADAIEIGVIISIWGLRLILYGFDTGDLLVLILLAISSCSLILALQFVYREMTWKPTQDDIISNN